MTAPTTIDLESRLLQSCAYEPSRTRRVVSNNVTARDTVDLESRLLQNCACERSRTRRVVSNNVTALDTVDLESHSLQNCAHERSRTRMAVSGQQQRDRSDYSRFRITFISKLCPRTFENKNGGQRSAVSNNVTALTTVDLESHSLQNCGHERSRLCPRTFENKNGGQRSATT